MYIFLFISSFLYLWIPWVPKSRYVMLCLSIFILELIYVCKFLMFIFLYLMYRTVHKDISTSTECVHIFHAVLFNCIYLQSCFVRISRHLSEQITTFYLSHKDHIFCMSNTPEFSVYNPGALFRKSLSNSIKFLTSAPGVVFG